MNVISKPDVLGKFQWPSDPSAKQCFSFPDTIIHYIAMNPSSPNLYNKMLQSCKYFFEKNPILIVANMDEASICLNKNCRKECCIIADIAKIKSKFWLTSKIVVSDASSNFISSSLCPKIFQCNVKELGIVDTKINYNDFKMLALFAENVYLSLVTMINNDGSYVMLESILEAIPNVVKFLYFFNDDLPAVTDSTVKNIAKLSNLSQLRRFVLFAVPETFNFKDVVMFSKDRKNINIQLYYAPEELPAEYMFPVKEFIDSEKNNPDRNLRITLNNWAVPGPSFFFSRI